MRKKERFVLGKRTFRSQKSKHFVLRIILLFVIQRFELALKRTSDVADCDDLLRTPEGVDLFDATCMRIQTIGEALKQIDTETKEKLLVYYPGIP